MLRLLQTLRKRVYIIIVVALLLIVVLQQIKINSYTNKLKLKNAVLNEKDYYINELEITKNNLIYDLENYKEIYGCGINE